MERRPAERIPYLPGGFTSVLAGVLNEVVDADENIPTAEGRTSWRKSHSSLRCAVCLTLSPWSESVVSIHSLSSKLSTPAYSKRAQPGRCPRVPRSRCEFALHTEYVLLCPSS